MFCSDTQLCRTLHDHMDYSPPGSSVHGHFQTRILEWVAISFSRESSQPRDQTHISCVAGEFFTTEPLGKPPLLPILQYKITIRNKEKKKIKFEKRKKNILCNTRGCLSSQTSFLLYPSKLSSFLYISLVKFMSNYYISLLQL